MMQWETLQFSFRKIIDGGRTFAYSPKVVDLRKYDMDMNMSTELSPTSAVAGGLAGGTMHGFTGSMHGIITPPAPREVGES